MKILVIGATGTIGKALSGLLKEKGHQVVEASRSSQPAIDFTDNSSIDRFYTALGEVDAIVTAAGDAAFVALNSLTEDQIQLSLHSKLMGQINAVRKGLKHLRPGGAAVITGGMLAYYPWPQTAMIAMVNRGLEGFVMGAALDMTEGRRVMIVHPPWVAETAAALGMDASPWPNAAKVARTYWHAIESGQNGAPVFVEGYGPK